MQYQIVRGGTADLIGFITADEHEVRPAPEGGQWIILTTKTLEYPGGMVVADLVCKTHSLSKTSPRMMQLVLWY